MIISVAIVDKDREYAERLRGGLEAYSGLNLSLFSSGEKFQKALEKNKYDIVFFDPDCSEDTLHFGTVKLPVCLCSVASDKVNFYGDNVLKIEKYQRISTIYKKAMGEYSVRVPNTWNAGNGNSKLVAVYSPIGGSGKTTVAYSLAMALAGNGRNVLYLNLESVCSSSAILAPKDKGVVDLLSAVEKGADFSLKLVSMLETGMGGVRYIGGFAHTADYSAVTVEEIESLLTSLKTSSDFEYVVIDTTSDTSVITKAALELSERIVLVENPGDFAAAKMGIYVDQADFLSYTEKIVRVMNFADSKSKYFNIPNITDAGMVQNYGNYPVKDMLKNISVSGSIKLSEI
ncbi:MAG: AAA family ATPase [Lachnospiraceae bacterium]|nr:AAA family ATPase [Lachnospiraceae bacterium]